jgi:ADP-ribose pyrophosphatase YjhB (NUDIX family)
MHHHEPDFRHCPVCGERLATSIIKEEEPARLVCPACEFVFYLDPKVVACSILEVDRRIVLLKRDIEPRKGKWVIPGGYVDRGETVEAAAIRETLEECGIRVRIKGVLGVYSYPGKTQVVIVYLAERLSGDLFAGDETVEAGWFSQEEIPWDDLAFRSTRDALKDYWNRKETRDAPSAHTHR